MTIRSIINRKYQIVSISENIAEAVQKLQTLPYCAVANDAGSIIGIICLSDVAQANANSAISNCNFGKPHIHPDDAIRHVYNLMKTDGLFYLPVYEVAQFCGVVAMYDVVEMVITDNEAMKRTYQQVIHDIRNPLANIQVLVNLMNETADDAEQLDYLKLCKQSCDHAQEILSDLLLMEVHNEETINRQLTEMIEFYNECISEQAGISRKKNIRIISTMPEVQLFKTIERRKVKRAVQNIISNAVKFSYPGGTIKIMGKVDDDRITLKVVDAGIGIPDNLKADIFNKFSSARRTGTSGEQSTGLGLSFAKECIENHDGKVSFKSEEGKGTKFYITL